MAEFDIVVFGASGFTGRLVSEYINQKHPSRRMAIAGRSAEKLARVRDETGLPAATPIIEADAADSAALEAMARRANVVLTTAGPYLRYGEALLAACARTGTDYVDLCGEPPFMWRSIEAHDAAAKASGARIVHSCGFDSIPFDLGVYRLQAEAQARFGAPIADVKGRVLRYDGEFSGGTAASGAATMALAAADETVMRRLLSPFALTPGFVGADQPPGDAPYFDDELGAWAGPFDMAVINTKTVHRSNVLMGHPYGADFTYEEMVSTGPGDAGEQAAHALANIDFDAELKHLKPGDGPDRAARERGGYEILFTGVSTSGERLSVVVGDDRDPGYGSTSKIIAEAAFCLIDDVPADRPGGVLTPAPVFGDALIDRLRANAGLTFALS